MCKATPGPWSLTTVPTSAGSCHKVGPFPARGPGEAQTFAFVYADGIRIGIDDELPHAIELAANARLIAAAPLPPPGAAAGTRLLGRHAWRRAHPLGGALHMGEKLWVRARALLAAHSGAPT